MCRCDGIWWDEQTENCLQFAIFEVSGEMQGPGLDRPDLPSVAEGTKMCSSWGLRRVKHTLHLQLQLQLQCRLLLYLALSQPGERDVPFVCLSQSQSPAWWWGLAQPYSKHRALDPNCQTQGHTGPPSHHLRRTQWNSNTSFPLTLHCWSRSRSRIISLLFRWRL